MRKQFFLDKDVVRQEIQRNSSDNKRFGIILLIAIIAASVSLGIRDLPTFPFVLVLLVMICVFGFIIGVLSCEVLANILLKETLNDNRPAILVDTDNINLSAGLLVSTDIIEVIEGNFRNITAMEEDELVSNGNHLLILHKGVPQPHRKNKIFGVFNTVHMNNFSIVRIPLDKIADKDSLRNAVKDFCQENDIEHKIRQHGSDVRRIVMNHGQSLSKAE